MTGFIHDQFSKDYLEELLKLYGQIQAPRRVSGEVREIDVFFSPSAQQNSNLQTLGLLGRFAELPAIFEPYRNAASKDEIHQLPRTEETLWLRILGRETVQKQAIDELKALPLNHPFRKATIELLYNLQQNLRVTQNREEEDRELIMRLEPLYQRDREQAKLEGRQEGEQRLIIRLLNRRLGEIDLSLILRVQRLSIEELETLGEALLDFSDVVDLEAWLNQQEG